MKAVILLNGEPFRGDMQAGDRVYCCDGAYRWAQGRIRIDENVGDFDSLDFVPEPPPKKIYPSEKNMTDGEIALNRAIEAGANEIIFYGGGGLREDHYMGNLNLLYAAFIRDKRAVLVTNYSTSFMAQGLVNLGGVKGRTISIVPFGGLAHIIDSRGLKYPLQGLTLELGSTRGISNLAEENEVAFYVAKGTVLIFLDF